MLSQLSGLRLWPDGAPAAAVPTAASRPALAAAASIAAPPAPRTALLPPPLLLRSLLGRLTPTRRRRPFPSQSLSFLFSFRMVVFARWTRVFSVRGLWVAARPLVG